MRMTESTISRVAVDLDFLKPFKASNVTTFDLAPSGDGTDVTWTMTGTRSAVMGVTPMMCAAASSVISPRSAHSPSRYTAIS